MYFLREDHCICSNLLQIAETASGNSSYVIQPCHAARGYHGGAAAARRRPAGRASGRRAEVNARLTSGAARPAPPPSLPLSSDAAPQHRYNEKRTDAPPAAGEGALKTARGGDLNDEQRDPRSARAARRRPLRLSGVSPARRLGRR